MESLTRKHLLQMRAALIALALVAYSAVAEERSGGHDFDFLFGDWQVHHQRLKARLAGSTEWIEFDGRQSTRPALGGAGNVSENWFDMNLTVTEIRFLSSGAVSVEVSAAASIDRPSTTTGVDAVRFQVHIPKGEVQNDVEALKALALKAVRGFKIG